jgi:hypothetical protein
MAPTIDALLRDLKRTTDLSVIDLVVDLEATPMTCKARIVMPTSDMKNFADWLKAFSIENVEWDWCEHRCSHFRASFPVRWN